MKSSANLILFFFIIFIICSSSVALAQEERTVEIDGYSVAVYFDRSNLETDSIPTVVFHSGSTVPIKAWEEVITKISTPTTIVAFDPPGIGASAWNKKRPTIENKNKWLHRLLEKIDAPTPYVLVGHSWAGWLVRDYEGRYPGQVAGLVLIDPTSSVNEFMESFKEMGLGDSEFDEFAAFTLRMAEKQPPPYKARQSVINEYHNTRSDPDVPAAPSVPTIVLAAGQFNEAPLPDSLKPLFDLDKFLEVLRSKYSPIGWIKEPPQSLFILSGNSRHCIHCDDPELVAWSIDRVLEWNEDR